MRTHLFAFLLGLAAGAPSLADARVPEEPVAYYVFSSRGSAHSAPAPEGHASSSPDQDPDLAVLAAEGESPTDETHQAVGVALADAPALPDASESGAESAPAEESPVPAERPRLEASLPQPAPIEVPVVEPPAIEAPVIERPVIERPQVERPVINRPTVERPTVERPVIERPQVERPQVERPAVEQPVVEAPEAEAPALEVPVVEAPQTQLQAVDPDAVTAPLPTGAF